MKILNILKSFNEIENLPFAIDFYQSIGVTTFVLDYYSTDGTSVWLDRHRIPYERIDAKGEGLELRLAQAKKSAIEKFSPDWVITSQIDEYIVTPSLPLAEIIRSVDERGYNLIKCRQLEFYHTGEESKATHPKNTFFYYKEKESTNIDCVSIQKVNSAGEDKRACLVEGFVLSYEKTKEGKVGDLAIDDLCDVRNFEPLRRFVGGT